LPQAEAGGAASRQAAARQAMSRSVVRDRCIAGIGVILVGNAR